MAHLLGFPGTQRVLLHVGPELRLSGLAERQAQLSILLDLITILFYTKIT